MIIGGTKNLTLKQSRRRRVSTTMRNVMNINGLGISFIKKAWNWTEQGAFGELVTWIVNKSLFTSIGEEWSKLIFLQDFVLPIHESNARVILLHAHILCNSVLNQFAENKVIKINYKHHSKSFTNLASKNSAIALETMRYGIILCREFDGVNRESWNAETSSILLGSTSFGILFKQYFRSSMKLLSRATRNDRKREFKEALAKTFTNNLNGKFLAFVMEIAGQL